MNKRKYDRIIIGAGLYGLYAALLLGKKGETVLVLEYDETAFNRATYINQARVHNGYHYPRSLSTAIKSASYFERFKRDFDFSIHQDFKKVYAISSRFSWTNADQFKKFCASAQIKCEEINPTLYFKEGMCDGVFDTEEYTYDAQILKKYFLEEIEKIINITVQFSTRIEKIEQNLSERTYDLFTNFGILSTNYLLNATYASVNQIINLLGFEKFKIKYEICEIILCKVSENLKNVGITVMDGPFFSVMPFGKTGLHSLTSVTFTPHKTSYDNLPSFDCQKQPDSNCSPKQLANCNTCMYKPETAWNYMAALAKKYLRDNIQLTYKQSLYAIKPILMVSEIDDSRPTLIKKFTENPTFVCVLSGKINTMYDIEEVL